MGLTTGNFLADLTLIATALIAVSVAYIKWKYSYWERKGVPYLEPTIPFGNLADSILQRRNLGALYEDIYKELKNKSCGKGFGGIYAVFRPVFVPIDPQLIKCIMQTDFNHFVDRGSYVNEKSDPLSAHLFNLPGQRWRNLRMKLTPTFTSGKMKYMFQTLVDCSQGLKPILERSHNEPVDIKDLVARYTVDVIGSCAFGLDCNSLSDPNNEFLHWGKRSFEKTKWETFKAFLTFAFPKFMLWLNIRVLPLAITDFYTRIVKETVEYREGHSVGRKDFMNLMLQLKNTGSVEGSEEKSNGIAKESQNGNGTVVTNGDKIKAEGITIEEIIAQSFVFFLAGFETSSTTMSFCLFELTQNLDIQEKLRREVNEVLEKHEGKITYGAMMDMKYMGMCIDETLRKYPPLSILNRICTKDYTIPGTNVTLKEGTHVHIPVMSIQYDPDYYPEPEKFDPNRFTEENKKSRPDFTHLPFGDGPRVCIGLRFGVMQTKVGLTALMKNFRFTLSEKTQTPLKLNPNNVITSAVGNIWLKAEKI